MRVLFIDNYDSFVYNIVHYIGALGADVTVFRNDAVTVADIGAKNPDAIVLSPGPGTPEKAGICLEVAQAFQETIPILGVCLGHQTLGQTGGGRVVHAPVYHGKVSDIYHENRGLFCDLPSPFKATRYHSLVVNEASLDSNYNIDARTEDGTVMGLSHKKYPLFGVQFHPESIATEHGHALLKNFLDYAGNAEN